ncbi:hypothetical protein [Flagellimonas beolgyonensis]|uniref:hypothetical protein n=1 Tax=Flagellimonas beolgyonensis TaxID=864064 RepID=UPI003D66113F
MEYSLRPKITKFLLKKIDGDSLGDFSSFHFDVDLQKKWVWISEKTPMDIIQKILPDFDIEINGSNLNPIG